MFVAHSIRFVALLLLAMTAGIRGTAAPATVEYNRDVRPILSENCFPCHGADSAARKAGLRLDHFEDATAKREDSAPAIVPGRPEQSELIRRVLNESDDVMPPENSHKVLTSDQKGILKRWVAAGAVYQPHWAFVAPQQPELPRLKNTKWVRNPVDQFVLARLEQEKLNPAPEADRRTLARRVSLDLTGLPPKPEEVEVFVSDKSPDAYEKLVDHYLASPHWGEHRGRYWLDVARYADTHGIHFDNFREMWTYRDWVINAFNTNMPFDKFTIEQLAGDLLPKATLEQQIGSGFNRCNITSNEGGAIEEEYLVLYARDRTETTAQVWMGLTAGCAVCHDHKYDPLSQKEFYQLAAFFNNTTQKGMDGNVKDTPPVIIVTKLEERARWEELLGETNAVSQRITQRKEDARAAFDEWQAKPILEQQEAQLVKDVPVFRAPLNDDEASLMYELGGTKQSVTLTTNVTWQDGAVAARAFSLNGQSPLALTNVGDYARDEAFSYSAWIRPTDDKDGAVLARMADRGGKYRGWDLWLEGNKPGAHLIHEWPDNTLKVVSKMALPKNRWSHVCVTYDGSSKAKGLKIYVNGEAQEAKVDKDKLTRSMRTAAPFKLGQRDTGSQLENTGVQDVRIYGRELKAEEVHAEFIVPRLKWLAGKPDNTRTKEDEEDCYSLWLGELDMPYRDATAALERLHEEQKGIVGRGTIAHVMRERENPPEAYLLNRGEYDKRGEKVAPATPQVFPPMAADLPRNRLGLAQWLLRPEHPLTARVTVNRFWQELFGTGLVQTAGDFGVAGEWPSHPELLDWLAVEFRESGWEVKQLYKLLVTSATYRQSAVITPEKLAKDPQNRLLARGPRFRLDAEVIRDSALAASGLLVEKVGGPSVKPYQPEGVWEAVAMPESNTKKYVRGAGEDLYRRSVYTFWKRAAPPAAMDILNAPSRETCTVRRERTDTPLQALVTLNDPQFFEAARVLAQRTLTNGGQTEHARLDYLARQLIARPLTAKEHLIVDEGLDYFLSHYQQSPRATEALLKVGEAKVESSLDRPTLAAYTMMANQLMNLDEALNK